MESLLHPYPLHFSHNIDDVASVHALRTFSSAGSPATIPFYCCHTVVGGLYLCFLCFIQSLGNCICAFLLRTVTLVLRCATGWLDSHWRHCRYTLVLFAYSWTVLCHSRVSVAICGCWMGIRGRAVHSVPSPVPAAGTMLAYRRL